MSADEFSFFDLDGAKFRRPNSSGCRSVDDILAGGKWVPYQGSDKLKPGAFGDPIPDPLIEMRKLDKPA